MKLIDWTTVPRLTQTNEGEFLSAHGSYAQVLHVWQSNKEYCIKDVALHNLRLAPADQQPWLVYEAGKTVIPEWADCEYQAGFTFTFEAHERVERRTKFNYKLGNSEGKLFKEGWTDNPNEVTV